MHAYVCVYVCHIHHFLPRICWFHISVHFSSQCPKQLRPASLVAVAVARPAVVPTGTANGLALGMWCACNTCNAMCVCTHLFIYTWLYIIHKCNVYKYVYIYVHMCYHNVYWNVSRIFAQILMHIALIFKSMYVYICVVCMYIYMHIHLFSILLLH